MSDPEAGIWAGASIHEVGQVAVAGTAVSLVALKTATLVKLVRVGALAPLVAASAARSGEERNVQHVVPAFLLAFVALVALRSLTEISVQTLDNLRLAATILLTGGMAGLGLRIRIGALKAAGVRPALVGLAAWLTVAVMPLVPLALLGG